MFDGHKKIRNYGPPMDGACICVCNQKLKWEVKCLILFVIASFVFASIRLYFAMSTQAYSQT